MSRKTLPVLIFFIIAANVFAENEFAFRIMPQFTGASSAYFGRGLGAAAAFDWRVLSLPRNIGMGLNAAGGFGTLSVADGSSLSMFEGGIGPFGSWRINDRFSLRANINIGVYRYQLEDNSNTRFFAGGALSGSFNLSPWFSLFAEGGYTHYTFSDTDPINAFKVGLGVSLNLGEILRPVSRVQAQRTAQYRVFPVSFAWYERNSLATVEITNNEPNAITQVNVSFLLEHEIKYEGELDFENILKTIKNYKQRTITNKLQVQTKNKNKQRTSTNKEKNKHRKVQRTRTKNKYKQRTSTNKEGKER